MMQLLIAALIAALVAVLVVIIYLLSCKSSKSEYSAKNYQPTSPDSMEYNSAPPQRSKFDPYTTYPLNRLQEEDWEN